MTASRAHAASVVSSCIVVRFRFGNCLQTLTLLVICLLLTVLPALPQERATVAPVNLGYLVRNAHSIIRGHIASVKLEPHPQFPNLQTVVVTIVVAKTLKGAPSTTMTFRQYAWNSTEERNAGGFHKAEELLLFLNQESPYGLTSPTGMEQGHFRVTRDNKGNTYAINGRRNQGLFAGMQSTTASTRLSAQSRAMLAKTAGPVSLSTLEDTIQALTGAQ